MAENVVELGVLALVAKLQAMTGPRANFGATYPNNPVIERIFKPAGVVTEFPHCCLIEKRAVFAQEATGSANQALYLHTVEIELYGYVKADDTVGSSTWVNRYRDDIRKTLIADSTLGGVVRDTKLDATDGETDEGELDPVGAFRIALALLIDENVAVG